MVPWSRFWGFFSFAVVPWLAAGTLGALIWLLVRGPWARALAAILAVVSLLLAWFVVSWGLNYQRMSWAQSHGRAASGGTLAELESLSIVLAHKTNQLSHQAAEHLLSTREIFEDVRLAYLRHGASDPLLAGDYPAPKAFPWPNLMSWAGIGGIFLAFTGESLVNTGPPSWELPFTAAHEAAHLHGFAREDEANFLGFWVLHDDPRPVMAYAAWSSALLYVASALEMSGPKGVAAWSRTSALLLPRVRRDWNATFAYWKRFQGPVGKASQAINDLYLKGQGQSDGVKSYGRMVDLLLAWRTDFAPEGGVLSGL